MPYTGHAGDPFYSLNQVYHRSLHEKPWKSEAPTEVKIPKTDAGTPVPLIFGRCRVRTPILSWAGPPSFETLGGRKLLRQNLFLKLGRGFPHLSASSLADNHIHSIWFGDGNKRTSGLSAGLGVRKLEDLQGGGTPEDQVHSLEVVTGNVSIVGDVEFLNGRPDQFLESAGIATTFAATMMMSPPPLGFIDPPELIGGFRNYMTMTLFQDPLGFQWGDTESIPAIHVEASSYGTNHPDLGPFAKIADEANPVHVIYVLMKLCGITDAEINMPSFVAAATTCRNEGLGYSRCISDADEAEEHILDIIKHVDGALYKNRWTQLWTIKLVRPDFDPATIFHVTKENCWELQGFAAGNWTNIPNSIEIVFEDRDRDYQDNSIPAQNQSNATAAGARDTLVLEFRGACTLAISTIIAAREWAARTRPVAKCRAICDRRALTLGIADPVKVTMEAYNCAGRYFRVVNIEEGTLEDGKVAVDLLEDTSSYVWRGETPHPTDFGSAGFDDLDIGFP